MCDGVGKPCSKDKQTACTRLVQDAVGITDKIDLVAKVREVATAGAAAAAEAPAGYAFDPETGYWYSADAGERTSMPRSGCA